MSLSIDSCWDAALELAALGDGALKSASRRSLASHLLPCVDCQILLAVSIVEWERERAVPRPPQSIERWRALALHLFSSGESEEDSSDAGYIAHPAERAWWWRFETMRLEDLVARTAWVLDGEQEERVHRWLVDVEAIARACGGLCSDETGSEGKVRKVCKGRRKPEQR